MLAMAGAVLAVAALALLAAAILRDDDRPVDPREPRAQRAIAVALEIVRGRPVLVARDTDDGSWEVTVRSDLGEFEVELDPDDLSFLGIDYD
jgi:hypothetical protein